MGGGQSLATHVNNHLCRYTPPDRFATAVFAWLSRETGELTYVNAGQNPPILSSSGRATFLESTGMPLGLVPEAEYCHLPTILFRRCPIFPTIRWA